MSRPLPLSIILLALCPLVALSQVTPPAPPSFTFYDLLSAVGEQAIAFARQSEQEALSQGIPLNAEQLRVARTLGVAEPEKVRVWYTDRLPFPQPPELVRLARQLGLNSSTMVAVTYGHGIHVLNRYRNQPGLLAHELVHVSQYERLGLEAFVRRYLLEVMLNGYARAPLELEAERKRRVLALWPEPQTDSLPAPEGMASPP